MPSSPTDRAHLVQLLLPLRDDQGERFPRAEFDRVLAELTAAFGGVTAYLRSPAAGAWVEDGRVDRDEVVMVEVVAAALDRGWWSGYRETLERRFRQSAVLMRASAVELL